MIELQLAADDFTRLRFAYSPLAEAIGSLNVLHSALVHPLHRRWADDTRQRLHGLDTTLLQAIAPPGAARLTPPIDLNTATAPQLQFKLVADWAPHQLRAELETVWCGCPMATAARDVISGGPAGARRVATALAAYWDMAIAPHWERMRSVLEADIARRARHAALDGISAMMNDLHPQLRLDNSSIHLAKRFQAPSKTLAVHGDGRPADAQHLRRARGPFRPGNTRHACHLLPAHGLGTVWENSASTVTGDPVSALIGKGRTAILRSTGFPRTTTDLARELHLSGATISAHLSILKRCGMVTS